MKTLVRFILCVCFVFPLGIFAQTPVKTCHIDFKGDTTFSCGSYLKVSFTEESVLLENERITNWTWDFGDGAVSSDSRPTHMYERPGKFTVKLRVKTNLNNTYYSSRKHYIIIKGEAFVNLGEDTVIEPGTSLVLDAGNPGSTYLWQDGSNKRTYTVKQPGEYWVHVKKGNCESRDRIKVSFKTRGVFSSITADTTYSCGSYLKVKFKEETIFEPGDFIINYYWDFGDGGKSNDYHPHYLYERPGLYTVRLIIHTHFGYKDTVVRENFINISGEAFVNLGKDTAIEPGSSLILDAGNAGATYSWQDGSYERTYTVKQPGEYWVHVKKGNCESRDRINISFKTHGVSSGFVADTTFSCGSYLKVNFKDETVLEPGDFISRWSWNFGDGAVSNDWRPAHQYNKPGHYTVQLIIQTAMGYSDTVVREKYINVEGNVFVNLGNDTAVCEGTGIELHAGNPGAQYWWNTGENTETITTTTPGEYWVHIKKGLCEARDIIRVSEKPPVFPQFGFNMNGNCLPMNVNFTDSSSTCGSNSIVRRRWDFGDGNYSDIQHPVHTFNSADTFIVRLTVWDNNGFSITRSRRVVVQPTPGAGPSVNLGSDTAICEVEPLILNAGNPGATYLWSNGETLSTTIVTETSRVWVRVEFNGCIASDTIAINVTPPLLPKFGYSIQSNCNNSVVTFTDSSRTCGVKITSWQWDFGDGTSSTLRNPVHYYSQPGEYIVRMTIYDNYGNSITRSKLMEIQQGTSLTVNLGSDRTVCMGNAIVLDAGITGATYSWSTGEQTQSIEVFDQGQYSVRVEKAGCIGADTITIGSVMPVTPGLDYTITGECLPTEVEFKDKSVVGCGQTIVSWNWDFGDGFISTEQNPTHSYTRSDSFAVRLTVRTNSGFTISKSKRLFIPNTVLCQKGVVNPPIPKGWLKEVKIKVSPNPSHGLVHVQFSKIPERAVYITVIDRYGQRVLTRISSDLVTVFNLGNLAKGYYTLELVSGKERKAIPILLQ